MSCNCCSGTMEMRAMEDIGIGQDLISPLPPIAFALHDSALTSHCSACFSPLPPHPFPPLTPPFSQIPCHIPAGNPSPLYCSPRCSSLDSHLHFLSAESHLLYLFRDSPPSSWDDSSDLRLSLRLLHIFQKDEDVCSPASSGLVKTDRSLFLGENNRNPFLHGEIPAGPDDDPANRNEVCEITDGCRPNGCCLKRIAGLMTNHERLICPFLGTEEWRDGIETPARDHEDSDRTVFERIREGGELIAKARTRSPMCVGKNINTVKREGISIEEMVLCLLLTNAVEVQDKTGRSLGIAVYNSIFPWINHSCSPNACYRFSTGFEHNGPPFIRIFPAITGSGCCIENGYDEIMNGDIRPSFSGNVGEDGYGPRVIVRSIKAIKKGEEVTIAYTDLLQPKEMRQLELWRKYRFTCLCSRCSSMPSTYVDSILQAAYAFNNSTLEIIPDDELHADETIEKLMERFDDSISEFLLVGDPKLCCENLENLLTYGNSCCHPESNRKLKLHLFHHLSLNAYTTLASAYKIHACDTLSLDSAPDDCNKLKEAFNLFRTSSAYSLLLAGSSHHLFTSEPGLLVSVANFWINAGESLLSFTKDPLWGSRPSSSFTKKCNKCSLSYVNLVVSSMDPSSMQLEEIQRQVLSCIANTTPKVWSFLASDSCFLKFILNPIDFSWLESCSISHLSGEGDYDLEVKERSDEMRIDLIRLSIHCLEFGTFLSRICYGSLPSIDMIDYRDFLHIQDK